MVASACALLLELWEERFLFVDRAWEMTRHDTWEAQRRAEIIMRLVTSLRIAHENCLSDVLWPTPNQDEFDQQRRALYARRYHNGWGPGRDRRGGGGDSGHGGFHRRSGKGGSSGGGSSKDDGSHRRTGGRGGGSGGGGHT